MTDFKRMADEYANGADQRHCAAYVREKHAFLAGVDAALEAAALKASEWLKPGILELRAGEMTAAERRTAKAILINVEAAIRAMKVKQP